MAVPGLKDFSFEADGKNRYKLSFSVDAARFEQGLQYSYNKNKGRLRVQGFRPGRAPRKLIEVNYGKEALFDDAVNFVLQDAYRAASEEFEKAADKQIISEPDIQAGEISAADGASFTAEVTVKPEAEVNGYLGLTYSPMPTAVTESELYDEIESVREKNSRTISVTDRPVRDNDTVNIDFTGYTGGVPFEGGAAEGFDLVIGSHSFVDTFEQQLIGHMPGEDVTVSVTFPEDYSAEHLCGKPAVFDVRINEIKVKELPAVDDEFAQDVSEFDTLEEYRADLRAKLEKDKEREAGLHKEEQIMTKVVEQTVVDIPQIMIDSQIAQMISNTTRQLRTQGLTLDMYLQYSGQTMETLRESYKPAAESQVKGRLALEAIAAKEHIEVTEAEAEEELSSIAESAGIDAEKFKSVISDGEKKSIALDVKVRKALDKVLETAKKDK